MLQYELFKMYRISNELWAIFQSYQMSFSGTAIIKTVEGVHC